MATLQDLIERKAARKCDPIPLADLNDANLLPVRAAKFLWPLIWPTNTGFNCNRCNIWLSIHRHWPLTSTSAWDQNLINKQVEDLQGRVHTYPLLFENGEFFSPVCPDVHTYSVKTVTENLSFQNTLQIENFWNTVFLYWRINGQNGGFWKRLRHGVGYNYMRMSRTKMGPFSATIAFRENEQNQLKNATCGRGFLSERRENSQF